MAYDHGNFDYDHGKIKPEGIDQFEFWNSSPIRRQEIHKLWTERNGNHMIRKSRKIIPYCSYAERGHGYWEHQRKQNTSTAMRRHYKSSANKKTRQHLQEDLRKQYDEETAS